MVSNRACALVILILSGLFATSQLLPVDLPAMRAVVGVPLLLLGPGWVILQFFVPGLRLFEAVAAVTLSLTVWTLWALLLLDLHAWRPLGAVDEVLALVAVVALISLRPTRAGLNA
jgi:hypothetical protein